MPEIASLTALEYSEGELLKAFHVLPSLRRQILSYLKRPDETHGKRLAETLERLRNWLEDPQSKEIAQIASLMARGNQLPNDSANELLNTMDLHVFRGIWKELFESDVVVDEYLRTDSEHTSIAKLIVHGASESRSESKEMRIQILKDYIYRHPGLYKSHLATVVAESTPIGVSESRIQQYIDHLAKRGEIMTVGGPQGNLRFCFPNPSRVEDRRGFYGKRFPVDGFIKTIQNSPFYYKPDGRFCKFGVVNTHMKDIGVLFPVGSLRDYKDQIAGFGILEPVEGHVPDTILTEMGVKESVADFVTPLVIEEKLPDKDEPRRWVDALLVKELESLA